MIHTNTHVNTHTHTHAPHPPSPPPPSHTHYHTHPNPYISYSHTHKSPDTDTGQWLAVRWKVSNQFLQNADVLQLTQLKLSDEKCRPLPALKTFKHNYYLVCQLYIHLTECYNPFESFPLLWCRHKSGTTHWTSIVLHLIPTWLSCGHISMVVETVGFAVFYYYYYDCYYYDFYYY